MHLFQLALAAATPAPGLGALPWFAHGAVVLAFGAGLLIWLSGQRLMRPAFVLIGALAGLVAAQIVPDVLRFGMAAWIIAAAGGAVGALLGWLLFRILVAHTLGMAGAAAMCLFLASIVRLAPAVAPPSEASEYYLSTDSPRAEPHGETARSTNLPAGANDFAIQRYLARLTWEDLKRGAAGAADRARAALGASDDSASENATVARLDSTTCGAILRAFASRTWEQLVRFWNDDLTVRGRAGLLLAGVIGYLVGLVIGLALPRRAAAVTTALVGPAIWLPAGAYLIVALGLPVAQAMPAKPEVWLVAWAAAAAIGLGYQLLRSSKPKPEPAKA